MKPEGRKYFKDKTGSKHKHKCNGKTETWWEDIICPNKALSKRTAEYEIVTGIDEFLDEDTNYEKREECPFCKLPEYRCEYSECVDCAYEITLEKGKSEGFENSWDDHFEWWDFADYWESLYG